MPHSDDEKWRQANPPRPKRRRLKVKTLLEPAEPNLETTPVASLNTQDEEDLMRMAQDEHAGGEWRPVDEYPHQPGKSSNNTTHQTEPTLLDALEEEEIARQVLPGADSAEEQ